MLSDYLKLAKEGDFIDINGERFYVQCITKNKIFLRRGIPDTIFVTLDYIIIDL